MQKADMRIKKTATLIRCPTGQLKAWGAAAKKEGRSLNAWMVAALNAELNKGDS